MPNPQKGHRIPTVKSTVPYVEETKMDHLEAARAGLEKIWTDLITKLQARSEKAKTAYTEFEAIKKDYEDTLAEVEEFKAKYPDIAKGGPKKKPGPKPGSKRKKKPGPKPGSKRASKKAAGPKRKKPGPKPGSKRTKKAKKKASKKAKGKAAEGRQAVARGDRPTIRDSIAIVMGSEVMGSAEIVAALAKKGWTPNAKDPRTYCLYTLSDNKDVFERVERGRYRVRDDVVIENDKIINKGGRAAKAAAKKAANNKPKKSDAEVQASLSELGIGGDGDITDNPFPG